MKQNQNKSIFLSQVCVLVFAALLLALDLTGWWWTKWFISLRSMAAMKHHLLLISLYVCSVPAWICLRALWHLLRNVKDSCIFVPENVLLMQRISVCCISAALICLLSSFYYLAFLVLALSSAFMALIVRIVRDAFQKAIAMQAELDLTI